jgi:hypothetical protein
MTTEQRKKLLLEYKLDQNDFYVSNDQFGDKIIVRRTGIDKIERAVGMNFEVKSIATVPYGDKACVTILGSGSTRDGDYAITTAHVNPDNCKYFNFSEIAEKRCRHRLLLKIARLYEFDIFSEIESKEWTESKNTYANAVADVKKKLKV